MIIVFVLCLVSETEIWSSETCVGYIKGNPDDYTLQRDGKKVSPPPDFVINGDVIIPHKNKIIKLIFECIKCSEQTITQKTIVKCDAEKETKRGFTRSLIREIIARTNVKRDELEDGAMMGLKGGTEKEKPCFPGELFRVTLCPANGTTVLYGESVFFRWEDIYEEISPCTESTLVIIGPDGKKTATPMKTGELLPISGKTFREKASYKWYVEVNGEKVSDDYRFSVLEKVQSDDIRSQLADISGDYDCPEPVQSLYLQLLSDIRSDLDLYADSLRIIKGYKNSQKGQRVAYEVFRRILAHED